ncbi:MAG: heavy metal translocating P-type ATPase [Pseudonocardia sp.]|nr:heavy metal translocating P-type ATPase [Pseudonocardia sp.]
MSAPPVEQPSGTAVTTSRTDLLVGGMTCGACANRVERKLRKLDDVQVAVNYATEKASITHPDSVSVEDLISAIESAGYTARVPAPVTGAVGDTAGDTAGDDPADPALAAHRLRLDVCAALSLPVIAMAMIPALQLPYWQWASLVLTAPVVVWGAWPFHRAAWKNVHHGAASMDTLVSLGSLAAFCWSLYALLLGGAGVIGHSHPFSIALTWASGASQVYFEVAAGVTTFVLAGRYVEAKARRRSGAALRALGTLAAKDAVVLRDGREVRVPVDRLAVDDRFVVRAGEKVATDGVVVDGSSTLDTSMITGESLPVDVGCGDTAVGGCVNGSGRLVVRATRIGADTALAQIGALVERAQTGKAAAQRLADRISAYFVPAVLILAAATWGFWTGAGAGPAIAFSAAVAVMIVACPCALGLATPTALLVGTGRGAQLGILITGPEVLESTRRIDTVVLDKTGTVTVGEMSVTDVVTAEGEDPDEVLAVAGALEGPSSHPVALAIRRHTAGLDLPAVRDAVAVDGLGTEGVVDGREVLIGRPLLLTERGVTIPAEIGTALVAAQHLGRTGAVLAWSGRARALFVVADTVRPTSAAAVADLRRLGLEPILLTGDNPGAARAAADEVGITTVMADALPADKVDVVRQLQSSGRVVAMVGDGVNDAAALAQADLGLAMGTGADVAIHASDLTLVRADLAAAVDAIRLSRRTLRVIKGNLFWAFAYNYLALPIAAAGLLNPMLAGMAMALSSVFVVSNSLRLRRFSGGTTPGARRRSGTAVLEQAGTGRGA